MTEHLPTLIFLAGVGQLLVLIAAALVPLRLNWTTGLAALPRLHRQLFWIYGGYIALAITALGLLCLINASALAADTLLSRCICGYIAVFWGIRLSLQTVLDVRPHLTAWWLTAGYHTLTVLFAAFTAIFGYAALRVGG